MAWWLARLFVQSLPGFVISFETIFGLPDERLTIRHDSDSGAQPYVAGTQTSGGA
jgi:4-hydroxy-tetrahydrodipicolinate reductase